MFCPVSVPVSMTSTTISSRSTQKDRPCSHRQNHQSWEQCYQQQPRPHGRGPATCCPQAQHYDAHYWGQQLTTHRSAVPYPLHELSDQRRGTHSYLPSLYIILAYFPALQTHHLYGRGQVHTTQWWKLPVYNVHASAARLLNVHQLKRHANQLRDISIWNYSDHFKTLCLDPELIYKAYLFILLPMIFSHIVNYTSTTLSIPHSKQIWQPI